MKKQIEITVPNDFSAISLKQYVQLQKDLDTVNHNLEEIVKEKDDKIDTLNREISDLEAKILQQQEEFSNNNLVKQLKQQVENLKVELELEKNRNYKPPKKEKPTEDNKRGLRFGNIINWVSKDEREDEKDIYGE